MTLTEHGLAGSRLQGAIRNIREAVLDPAPVAGLTHQFYKYPARFSPRFARAAIEEFSRPGDLVLDPYMGGGTTIVEALSSGRRSIGTDINSLAVFVSRAKTTRLTAAELSEVEAWVLASLHFGYHDDASGIEDVFCEVRTRNLHLPRARALKKFVGFALASCNQLSSTNARLVARCALLNVSQWALNGRKQPPTLSDFRKRLGQCTLEMLDAIRTLFEDTPDTACMQRREPELFHASAENLLQVGPFRDGEKADLVVTSPPYPGVHILYHRWQVDGRRETPAPYWIAGCLDGQGDSYYNFGSRKQAGHDDYFSTSLRTLEEVRRVTRDGGVMVQLIAFSDPGRQLPRYLSNMSKAGFHEVRQADSRHRRIWRQVPRRSWHAGLQGATEASREVVLIHTAI